VITGLEFGSSLPAPAQYDPGAAENAAAAARLQKLPNSLTGALQAWESNKKLQVHATHAFHASDDAQATYGALGMFCIRAMHESHPDHVRALAAVVRAARITCGARSGCHPPPPCRHVVLNETFKKAGLLTPAVLAHVLFRAAYTPLHALHYIHPLAFTPCICRVSCRLPWGMSWARSWSQPSLRCGAVKPRPTQVLPPCSCATERQDGYSYAYSVSGPGPGVKFTGKKLQE